MNSNSLPPEDNGKAVVSNTTTPSKTLTLKAGALNGILVSKLALKGSPASSASLSISSVESKTDEVKVAKELSTLKPKQTAIELKKADSNIKRGMTELSPSPPAARKKEGEQVLQQTKTCSTVQNLSLTSSDTAPANKIPILAPSLAPIPAVKQPSFRSIYNKLHTRFPEIINMSKPVLLAVGIRKEMSQATGVSSVILKRWIAWYCRKSNYYTLHKQGATRFNLDGSEAGVVTEKHQEKMDEYFEKVRSHKSLPQGKSTNQIGQDSNLTNIVDDTAADTPSNILNNNKIKINK